MLHDDDGLRTGGCFTTTTTFCLLYKKKEGERKLVGNGRSFFFFFRLNWAPVYRKKNCEVFVASGFPPYTLLLSRLATRQEESQRSNKVQFTLRSAP